MGQGSGNGNGCPNPHPPVPEATLCRTPNSVQVGPKVFTSECYIVRSQASWGRVVLLGWLGGGWQVQSAVEEKAILG